MSELTPLQALLPSASPSKPRRYNRTHPEDLHRFAVHNSASSSTSMDHDTFGPVHEAYPESELPPVAIEGYPSGAPQVHSPSPSPDWEDREDGRPAFLAPIFPTPPLVEDMQPNVDSSLPAPLPSVTQTPRAKPRTDVGITFEQPTPHHVSSHDKDNAYGKVEQIQCAVSAELAGAWVEEQGSAFQEHLENTIDTLYPGLDATVVAFLQTYAGYNNGRWTAIPSNPTAESELYDPLVGILSDIMAAIQVGTKRDGQKRRTENTHNILMEHTPSDAAPGKTLKSKPDISTFGNGPSVTPFSETDILLFCYRLAASLWEVKLKLEKKFGPVEKAQVAVYARNNLIEFRVLRFDRAGCYYTTRINYHAKPKFFVKIAVLLASFDEGVLGFDQSIYWDWENTPDRHFLKMTPGKLFDPASKKWEANSEQLVFVLEATPMFSRHTIRSRGTVCWGATYKDKTYVVKDYWCADGRMSEPGMLAKLVGVRGVGQIFAFETDRESIRTERGFGATLMHSDSDATEVVLGRTLMRVVVRRYGDTLEQAHSAHKLLCAIRDIVRGHRDSLLERGILHRDISFNNLLLSELSEDGEGVIIDWDLAIELIKILGGSTKGDSRTGTRAFQSIKVLKASPLLGHHDHMDDLESVFYVLYYVLYGHGPTGTRLPDEDMQIILDWENPTLNATTVSRNKAGFMVTAFEQPLTRYDGAEKDRLETFMQELQALFKVRCESIAAALKNRNPVEFPRFTKEAATADYENFLAIVDAAIADIPEPAPSFKRKQPDTTDGAHASYVLPSPPKSRRLSNVGLRGSHSSRGQTSSLGGAKGSGLRMSMPAEGETPTKPTHTHASTSSTSNNGSPLRRGRGQRKSRVTKSTYVESEDSDEGEKKTDDDYVEGNRRKGKGKGKRP